MRNRRWDGWLEKRDKDKQDAVVFEWLENVLNGKEEFYWHISEPVEWDTKLQCWTVLARYEGNGIGVELKPGERVFLVRGRGDLEEYAEIGEKLRVSDSDGSERYSLVFTD